jgi:hypothetical protein
MFFQAEITGLRKAAYLLAKFPSVFRLRFCLIPISIYNRRTKHVETAAWKPGAA